MTSYNFRHYDTIGIEGFVSGPPDPLPADYDQTEIPEKPSYVSWEITGVVKESPEDFVVREVLPNDESSKFSKLFSHYHQAVLKADGAGKAKGPLNVASMPSIPPIRLPDDSPKPSSTITESNAITDEPTKKKRIIGGQIPSATTVPDTTPVVPELSFEESIKVYIENVATNDHPTASLLELIELLNGKAINRIPTCQNGSVIMSKPTEVWIPPLYLAKDRDPENSNRGPTTETEMKALRKAFHKAIRISYPFLKTESSAKPEETAVTKSNADHWIKISIDDCFDGLVEYLDTPRDDLKQLFLFRNWGFEGVPAGTDATTKPGQSVVLKLRPGVSKDDRRNVHHTLAQKNKHFETSIRNQAPKTKEIPTGDKDNSPTTTDLVVSWKKQALRKGSKKRRRSENGSREQRDNHHLLCVLKKTQKEHLTAMQILSRSFRCRQGDIGFAGIKDMQAITYQFVTLRNMGQHRAERSIRQQLQNRDVELKILSTNVDFLLNIGDLEGNQFEITVRNLKRVKVDWDGNEPVKESFVDCEREHINRMVERIQKHGYINFYGEQRIGAPGKREEIGVRAFEIGRAMVKQDFKKAIDLLMEGTRHHETKEARCVRQAWKDSSGNAATTLKAFGKADIMPRERAILKGLNRYPDNQLEAIRFLSYNMRIFYVNAYQSYLFNKAASKRIRLHGDCVVKGDLYFDKEGDHRDSIKVVQGTESPRIQISQVVLPLPGYNVQYPENEIGKYYQHLMTADGVKFEKNAVPEATAGGSYRKLIVHPKNLTIESPKSSCDNMKLSFQLPKGSYATMLLRELMLTTVVRSKS